MPDLVSWDFETDPHNPQPIIFPVCPDCGEPYYYSRYLSFATGKYVWAWSKPAKVPKGCRHKGEAKVEDTRSEVETRPVSRADMDAAAQRMRGRFFGSQGDDPHGIDPP